MVRHPFWFTVVLMTRYVIVFLVLALASGFVTLVYMQAEGEPVTRTAFLQKLAMPGELSNDHSTLQNDCGACHTAVKGPSAAKCMACHANNENFTIWPELKFHLAVPDCRVCHEEHTNTGAILTKMNHDFVAEMGFKELMSKSGPVEKNLNQIPMQGVTIYTEKDLRCASCHLHSDAHEEMFGQRCGYCHQTDHWMISSFRHPSSASTMCAQCHRAPPCHFTDHFERVCGPVAGQPKAEVRECDACHQVPNWNLIKGAGWYKTH